MSQDRSRRKRQRRVTEADEDAAFAAEMLGLVYDRVRDVGDVLRVVGDTAGGLAGGSFKLISASVNVRGCRRVLIGTRSRLAWERDAGVCRCWRKLSAHKIHTWLATIAVNRSLGRQTGIFCCCLPLLVPDQPASSTAQHGPREVEGGEVGRGVGGTRRRNPQRCSGKLTTSCSRYGKPDEKRRRDNYSLKMCDPNKPICVTAGTSVLVKGIRLGPPTASAFLSSHLLMHCTVSQDRRSPASLYEVACLFQLPTYPGDTPLPWQGLSSVLDAASREVRSNIRVANERPFTPPSKPSAAATGGHNSGNTRSSDAGPGAGGAKQAGSSSSSSSSGGGEGRNGPDPFDRIGGVALDTLAGSLKLLSTAVGGVGDAVFQAGMLAEGLAGGTGQVAGKRLAWCTQLSAQSIYHSISRHYSVAAVEQGHYRAPAASPCTSGTAGRR